MTSFIKKETLVFLILFLFLSTCIYAQEITCEAIDIKSNMPIAFATVIIKNQKKGVIADENGFFRIPYLYKYQKDTIRISSIGYKTKLIALNSLSDIKKNIILMQQNLELLNKVVLNVSKKKVKEKQLSGYDIVKNAIQSISKNFPETPFSTIGYYRDYQLVNNHFFNLNEAILEDFDSGFQTDKFKNTDNQTALYYYKKNKDFPIDSVLTSAYGGNTKKYIDGAVLSSMGGNELSILNIHNPIRHNDSFSFSFAGVFKDDFLSNHTFYVEKIVYRDDIPLYKINFNTIKDVSGIKNNAKGVIYIARNNFAIHKLEYYGYQNNEKEPFYTVKVEYLPKGKLMYLNYISFNNNFEMVSKGDFKIEDIGYNIADNAFYITFNNSVKESSISNRRNYFFSFKGKELIFNKIKLYKPKVIKITLKKGTLKNFIETNLKSSQYFKYHIKNILDITNRKLNKITTIKGKQYREFFVQEAFPIKACPINTTFINKTAPLSKSLILPFKNYSKYWINSPLKQ